LGKERGTTERYVEADTADVAVYEVATARAASVVDRVTTNID
jgi:hypothetical protein